MTPQSTAARQHRPPQGVTPLVALLAAAFLTFVAASYPVTALAALAGAASASVLSPLIRRLRSSRSGALPPAGVRSRPRRS